MVVTVLTRHLIFVSDTKIEVLSFTSYSDCEGCRVPQDFYTRHHILSSIKRGVLYWFIQLDTFTALFYLTSMARLSLLI